MRPIVHRTLQKKICCVSVNHPSSSSSSSSLKLVPIHHYFPSKQFRQDWTFRKLSDQIDLKVHVSLFLQILCQEKACNHLGLIWWMGKFMYDKLSSILILWMNCMDGPQ
jgi:hypothetical protein